MQETVFAQMRLQRVLLSGPVRVRVCVSARVCVSVCALNGGMGMGREGGRAEGIGVGKRRISRTWFSGSQRTQARLAVT